MPFPEDSAPFATYLRQLMARLDDVPPDRQAAIQRELWAHLEDAAHDRDADPHDPHVQQQILDTLGPDTVLAAAYGSIHGRGMRGWRAAAVGLGMAGGLLGLVGSALLHQPDNVPMALLAGIGVSAAILGLAGARVHQLRQRHGPVLLFSSSCILMALGAWLFYAVAWSATLLSGLVLLIAGELLMLSALLAMPSLTLSRRALTGLLIGFFVLISLVPPFSAVPNPLGAVALVTGGYQQPLGAFWGNTFATVMDADQPVPAVTARLDQLLGQTGLEPLKPHAPLVHYTIDAVQSASLSIPWTRVAVTLQFADGSTREATIPVQQVGRYEVQTSLDRLATAHTVLPGLPAADSRTSFHLGTPQRLGLHPDAEALFSHGHQVIEVQWSPDGQWLLVQTTATSSQPSVPAGFWIVPLDGTAPRQLTTFATTAHWSATGDSVITVQHTGARHPALYTVVAHDLQTMRTTVVGSTDRQAVALHGDAVYLVREEQLWRVRLSDGASTSLGSLPNAAPVAHADAMALAPDGSMLAYRCTMHVCLVDLQYDRLVTRLPLPYQAATTAPAGDAATDAGATPRPTAAPDTITTPYLASLKLAWSPDSTALAISTAATDQRGAPTLYVLTRDGVQMAAMTLGADGRVDHPAWLPDSQHLMLTSYPAGGRRLLLVTPTAQTVADLSQPHWDARGRLHPDGQQIIVWNGNGGLWTVPIQGESSR
jgi:hypothetical protein